MDLRDNKTLNKNWLTDDGLHDGGVSTGIGFTISWQRGPVHEEGDRNGAFLIEVLEACENQLKVYQDGKFVCEENADALEYLNKSIGRLKDRLNRRKEEGTLGSTKV